MELEKVNTKYKNILKISTILIYAISILIYEIGICNGETIKNFFEYHIVAYNFSLCRIVLYAIFFALLLKNLDKFIYNAIETLNTKTKKIIIGIYIPVAVITVVYVLIKWISLYKALTLTIVLLMGLVFLVYVSNNYIKNTILITFTLGVIFTFTTNFHHSLDEKKHMSSAINVASGNINFKKHPLNEPAFNNIYFSCDIDMFAQFYNKKYEPNLTEDWEVTEDSEVYFMSSCPADYNFIMYLPSAAGITFAKILGGSIADVYITGRLFNLIVYMLMVILILKLLPYKKKIFFIIYMIPLTLLIAASYSVDGITIGIIGTFIAYCLNLSQRDYKEIKLKQILILMALYGLCLIAKNLAYCTMILFVLVLPIFKILKNNKKSLPIIISIIVIAVVICGILIIGKFTSTVEAGGDIRGGDTSVAGQIEFLLSSPTNIIKVGFEHIMNSLLNYNWYNYLNHEIFFGKYYSQIFLLILMFVAYACITDKEEEIPTRVKIVSLITFFVVYATTSLMLYLTFTPVGQINISGYQPRYLTPVFPIILMLIKNKITTNANKKEESDTLISLISGLFIILNLFCVTYVI